MDVTLHYYDIARKHDFLIELIQLKVPADCASILRQLKVCHDPQKTQIAFAPRYARFSFNHDYGRMMPPALMHIAYSVIASVSNPDEVK